MLQGGFDFGSKELANVVFLAIKPDTVAGGRVKLLAHQLKRQFSLRGEPMDASRLHVTLQKLGEFAGDIPPGLVTSACEAAARIAVPAFDLAFDEVMNLENPMDPVVVLCGSNSDQAIAPLWSALVSSLARVGIKSPAKLSISHMTLIYGSSAIQKHQVDPVGWRVDELVLVHSLIGRGQHIHLGNWSLTA